MMATAHVLVAGAIARTTLDPLTTTFLCIGSHFIMDAVPHWDLGTNWRSRPKSTTGIISIMETVIAITVAYFVYGGKVSFPLLTLAIVASLLPDWLETPWYIFFARQNKHKPGISAGVLEKFAFAVYKLENVFHTKAQFPFGAITQIATVVFFLVLLQ